MNDESGAVKNVVTKAMTTMIAITSCVPPRTPAAKNRDAKVPAVSVMKRATGTDGGSKAV